MMPWFLKRTATAVGIVLLAAAIAAYLLLRGSLPQLDGEHVVGGINATVRIERDALGVPVIRAENRPDLAFGLGFAHAQDRYFQMDLLRRRAAGELAALFGPVALPFDRRNRLHRFRARAAAVIAQMPAAYLDVLEAYTEGVNAGLGSLGSRPFEYWLLRETPAPWVREDTILASNAMFLELNDSTASRDTRRGVAQLVLPETLFTFLYPDGTDWDAPLIDEPIVAAAVPELMADTAVWPPASTPPANLAGLVDEFGDTEALKGSNNWAVSGALTESGRAIIANDMHLGVRVPNTWYRARLIQTDGTPIDMSGVTLPGTPVVVAGSNGKVAWGFTNSNGDWTDAVLVRPGSDADTYLAPNGERAFDVFEEVIEIKGADSETLTVRETVWGPLRQSGDYPDGDIAISWIAHHAEAVNFNHLKLETVTSVAEALDVANTMGIAPQNFVVGDVDGNIAWTIAGRIPRRGGATPTLPADWSGGSGWQGWLAVDEYPRVVNPPSGRIWTANARVASGDQLAVVGDGGYDLGARQRQIRDALLARERFVETDMLDIHLDDRALFLERWRDLLLETLDDEAVLNHPARSEYRDHVRAWTPNAAVDSVGYRLVRVFRSTVEERVFRELVAAPIRAQFGEDAPLRRSNQFEGPLWSLVTRKPDNLRPPSVDSWDELLLESVDAVLRDFDDTYGDGLGNRTWGERNTSEIRHPLSQNVPIFGSMLDMAVLPLPGDSHMPRVQAPVLGASERYAVSPGAERDGYLHMPGGQSGHPLSPHYRDGHKAWTDGLPTSFQPGEPRNTLRLLPTKASTAD